MKKLPLLITLFAGFSYLFFSCDKPDNLNSGCTASGSGDTLMLTLNKSMAIFPACMQDLQANLISINDSRCPKGANCIVKGELTAVLQLGTQFAVKLEQGKLKDTIYQNKSYGITLVDAFPYPSVSTPTSPGQSAQIRIIKY